MVLYGPGMAWELGLMSISFLVFWGFVIVAIVLLIRHFGRPGQSQGPYPRPGPYGSPLAPAEVLLAERFARGEIDEEEYQRRLNTLRASAGPPQGG